VFEGIVDDYAAAETSSGAGPPGGSATVGRLAAQVRLDQDPLRYQMVLGTGHLTIRPWTRRDGIPPLDCSALRSGRAQAVAACVGGY
jgi:hypothetical protein